MKYRRPEYSHDGEVVFIGECALFELSFQRMVVYVIRACFLTMCVSLKHNYCNERSLDLYICTLEVFDIIWLHYILWYQVSKPIDLV